jgi:hypothetical protein
MSSWYKVASDVLLLVLTAALTWEMWRAMGTWGDVVACRLWGWAWWFAREMRAM